MTPPHTHVEMQRRPRASNPDISSILRMLLFQGTRHEGVRGRVSNDDWSDSDDMLTLVTLMRHQRHTW